MGKLRSFFFRFIYPLPQKGEDPLVYKQTLMDEYVQPYQQNALLKIYFLSGLIRSDKKRKDYIKSCKDNAQRQHLNAYKTWRKIVCGRDIK